MSVPQPKILTAIIVPDGGWSTRIQISDATPFDTNINFTIAAGTYYMAWDHQSDDFLHAFCTAFSAAAATAGFATAVMSGYMTSAHKVGLAFHGAHFTGSNDRQVKIVWTNGNGPSIAAILGFDGSADDSSTGTAYPHFTGDYQHSHAWYADADGRCEELLVEDINEVTSLQSVAHSGKVVTQFISGRFKNMLKLRWLPVEKTFSRGISYTVAPVYPYTRNNGLECWWRTAREGRPFRVYWDGCSIDTARGVKYVETSGTTTTVTISGVTLQTDPMRWSERLLYIPVWNANGTSFPERFYVTSHTGTVFTVPNADSSGLALGANDDEVHLFEQRYRPYVLDLEQMQEFAPREAARHGLYDIDIPLRLYV